MAVAKKILRARLHDPWQLWAAKDLPSSPAGRFVWAAVRPAGHKPERVRGDRDDSWAVRMGRYYCETMSRVFVSGTAALVLVGCGLIAQGPQELEKPEPSSPTLFAASSSASGATASIGVGSGSSGSMSSASSASGSTTSADQDGGDAEATEASSDGGNGQPTEAGGDGGNAQPTEAGSDGGDAQPVEGGSDGDAQPAEAGSDDAASVDATTADAVGGSCEGGATLCSGDAVETCSLDGRWGPPWTCATGTCTDGGCVGSTTTAPSCAPGGLGLTDCGPGGSGAESCCTSPEVTGGTFYLSDDLLVGEDGGSLGEVPDDPASVSGFRLDKYLVTVGRFRQYVNYLTTAGGAPPANGSGIHTHVNGGLGLVSEMSAPSVSDGLFGPPGPPVYETGWDATDWNAQIATGSDAPTTWSANLSCTTSSQLPGASGSNRAATWSTVAGSQDNLPINCVDWYEAYAFCIWDGGFLPSEAEWQYVEVGGSQQLEEPWGSAAPGTRNQYAIYGCLYGSGTCGLESIAPVGTALLGIAYWGQLDMVGEVLEWNLDFAGGYGSTLTWSALSGPCPNCAFLTPTMSLALPTRERGGVAFDEEYSTPQRGGNVATYRDVGIGFRCARTP
jgi:formylglycine-generating enzyme required for sulfatase activity